MILELAREVVQIKGHVDHLIPGIVSHLQYADNTMIMIAPDDISIVNLKFLLLCFENMACLKINFSKSEVGLVGFDQWEQRRIANLLNWKLGSFPIISLGLPGSDQRLSLKD
jgi:hypothetical protein